MASKPNSKSVRMSNEVLQIVESCPGEGFNQKFENLVIDYKKTISEREARKVLLEDEIGKLLARKKAIRDDISKGERVMSSLKTFMALLDSVN